MKGNSRVVLSQPSIRKDLVLLVMVPSRVLNRLERGFASLTKFGFDLEAERGRCLFRSPYVVIRCPKSRRTDESTYVSSSSYLHQAVL